MSFLFGTAQRPLVESQVTVLGGGDSETETLYRDLIEQRPALLEEKLKLHARIIDEFNLTMLEKLPRTELIKQVAAYVAAYVRAERISLNQRELEIFSEEIVDEMTGYGPIEPLLKDPTVTDILINTHKLCFVERFGKLYETKVHFKDEALPEKRGFFRIDDHDAICAAEPLARRWLLHNSRDSCFLVGFAHRFGL